MGQSFSCTDGAAATSTPDDDISKTSSSKLHKGAPKAAIHESLINTKAPEEPEELMPTPSLVISWVLRDVAESAFPQTLLDTYEDLPGPQTEAHASRLRECWKQHGDAFPTAFAAELSDFVESLQDEDFKDHTAGKIVRVAIFMAEVLQAKTRSST